MLKNSLVAGRFFSIDSVYACLRDIVICRFVMFVLECARIVDVVNQRIEKGQYWFHQ